MAIFGKDKKEKKEKEDAVTPAAATAMAQAEKKASPQKEAHGGGTNIRKHDHSAILLRPRVTEKASFAQEKGVYVFEVLPRATKKDVAAAVEHLYKVKPVKVNIVKIPSKLRISQFKRTRGVKSGGKKAYVFLKKGDSLEIV